MAFYLYFMSSSRASLQYPNKRMFEAHTAGRIHSDLLIKSSWVVAEIKCAPKKWQLRSTKPHIYVMWSNETGKKNSTRLYRSFRSM